MSIPDYNHVWIVQTKKENEEAQVYGVFAARRDADSKARNLKRKNVKGAKIYSWVSVKRHSINYP